ncbi:MAG TPA: hypothetical protein VFD82_01700, partial [Planctomycetota bacterium]|nr:hypothetical protein [Planctomycetota bacterium]
MRSPPPVARGARRRVRPATQTPPRGWLRICRYRIPALRRCQHRLKRFAAALGAACDWLPNAAAGLAAHLPLSIPALRRCQHRLKRFAAA